MKETTFPQNSMLHFRIIAIVAFGLLTTMFLIVLQMQETIKNLQTQQNLLSNELSSILAYVIEGSMNKSNQIKSENDINIGKIWNELKSIQYLLGAYERIFIETKIDYASESGGARILSIGNTKSISLHHGMIERVQFYFQYGHVPVSTNGPEKILQPSIRPGECFAFVGKAEITIQLIQCIHIESVSIEHILESTSPNHNISNAPKDFSVYGFNRNNGNPSFLGHFRYEINKQEILQEFFINNEAKNLSYDRIQFMIHSNHGNNKNTCLYRIRVHGSPCNRKSNKFSIKCN